MYYRLQDRTMTLVLPMHMQVTVMPRPEALFRTPRQKHQRRESDICIPYKQIPTPYEWYSPNERQSLVMMLYCLQPAFHTTCAMSRAVFTVSTIFPISPGGWGSSSFSSKGINMPEAVRRSPPPSSR
jgi:hypothetical protein